MLIINPNIKVGAYYGSFKSDNPSPYPKGVIGVWKTYGKSNTDSDRNILKDLSGNNRDLTLMNFGYALGSGYGIYNPSFNAPGSQIKVPHTDYSFTVPVGAPMAESGFGFWAFGNNVKILKFNLKVSNLADTDEVYMCQYISGQYGKVRLHNGMNSIYINIEGSTKPNYPYVSLYSITPITKEFTSIVVPDYEGGLIFDGVDDYAVNNNMSILTKEKGYTLFVVGKILGHATSTAPNNLKALVSNASIWTANDSAFIYQYENTSLTYALNFGAANTIQREQSILGYQTSKLYNGAPIVTGNTQNGSVAFLIGRLSNDFARYTNLVFYAAELYDHDLTAEEIQQVSDRMLAEWYEKAYSPLVVPYQALWTTNGKTNQDADKNVPNLIDATNPLVPSNFLWALNSGYGKYQTDFDKWIYSGSVTGQKGQTSLTIQASSANRIINGYVSDIGVLSSIKLNISGLLTNTISFRAYIIETSSYIVIRNNIGDGLLTLTEDDFKIIGSNTVQYYSIFIDNGTPFEGRNIVIEELPEQQGLSLDGVDDVIASSKNLPVLTKYTVVGDFDILSSGSRGIKKNVNWFMYRNSVIINYGDNVSVLSALAISSSGLVVTPTESFITDKVGTATTNGPVLSVNNPNMVFRSLAIIPYELNETQIRVTLEYLKTIKANNIE